MSTTPLEDVFMYNNVLKSHIKLTYLLENCYSFLFKKLLTNLIFLLNLSKS